MLRTRSWSADGRKPASASAAATSAGGIAGSPRTWMLPREVSCSSPLPYRCAIRASAPSATPVVCPPGTRTRIMAPSAA